ncbi:polysaccharide deacetylase family protein [Streptobacillus felis]|uniref:Polysaccharide deacetylase family protein n=1 Tax=Streptobacillus felis TaxID=1384509 RepID=A0A7Z0PGL0_9FUSO|nr:polysaccharide deacetylase family protein [Streptobacillus felis]NYV28323.1 polysaccharide deacetylase family protein [Streptobacillus felis]
MKVSLKGLIAFMIIFNLISCGSAKNDEQIKENVSVEKPVEEIKEEKVEEQKEEVKEEVKEEKTQKKNEDTKEEVIVGKNDILRYHYRRIAKKIDPNVSFDGVNLEKYRITDTEIFFGDNEELALDLEKFRPIFKSGVGLPSLYYGATLNPKKREVDMTKKHLVFTFDDGPRNKNHEAIREIFNEYDQTASFFVLGEMVKKNPQMIVKTYLDGHEIMGHSYTHPNLTKLSSEKVWEEYQKTNDEIFKVIGLDVWRIRPPYGAANDRVRDIVGGRENSILWDVDSLDWKSRNVDKIVARVLPVVKDGDVVLFHDLYKETYEAVKYMVPILIEQGYQFISYEDMMNIKNR